MRRFVTRSLRFLRRDDGPSAVEYALVLALIVVVCIVAITALGSGVTKPFKKYSKSRSAVCFCSVSDLTFSRPAAIPSFESVSLPVSHV